MDNDGDAFRAKQHLSFAMGEFVATRRQPRSILGDRQPPYFRTWPKEEQFTVARLGQARLDIFMLQVGFATQLQSQKELLRA